MALLLCFKNTLAMNKFLTALFLLIICPWFLTIQLLLKIWISFFWEKKKKEKCSKQSCLLNLQGIQCFSNCWHPCWHILTHYLGFSTISILLEPFQGAVWVPGQPSLQFAPCHATGMLQCSLCTLLCPQKETLLTTLKFYTRFSRAFHFPFLHHYTT